MNREFLMHPYLEPYNLITAAKLSLTKGQVETWQEPSSYLLIAVSRFKVSLLCIKRCISVLRWSHGHIPHKSPFLKPLEFSKGSSYLRLKQHSVAYSYKRPCLQTLLLLCFAFQKPTETPAADVQMDVGPRASPNLGQVLAQDEDRWLL